MDGGAIANLGDMIWYETTKIKKRFNTCLRLGIGQLSVTVQKLPGDSVTRDQRYRYQLPAVHCSVHWAGSAAWLSTYWTD